MPTRLPWLPWLPWLPGDQPRSNRLGSEGVRLLCVALQVSLEATGGRVRSLLKPLKFSLNNKNKGKQNSTASSVVSDVVRALESWPCRLFNCLPCRGSNATTAQSVHNQPSMPTHACTRARTHARARASCSHSASVQRLREDERRPSLSRTSNWTWQALTRACGKLGSIQSCVRWTSRGTTWAWPACST